MFLEKIRKYMALQLGKGQQGKEPAGISGCSGFPTDYTLLPLG
jgi:hypothetical protein